MRVFGSAKIRRERHQVVKRVILLFFSWRILDGNLEVLYIIWVKQVYLTFSKKKKTTEFYSNLIPFWAHTLCPSLRESRAVHSVAERATGMCNSLVGTRSYVTFFFTREPNSVFIELLINGVRDPHCKGSVTRYRPRKPLNTIDKKKNTFRVKRARGSRLHISVFERFSVDGEKAAWTVVVSADVNQSVLVLERA